MKGASVRRSKWNRCTVTRPKIVWMLVIASLLVAFGSGSPAFGRTYQVSQCRLPNGSFTGADDVTAFFTSPFSYYSTNECDDRGSMGVALEPTVSHRATTGAFISFSAPPDTRVVGVEGNRSSQVGQGGAFRQGTTGIDAGALQLEQCANASSCSGLGSGSGVVGSNAFRFDNLSTDSVTFYAACVGGQDCPPEDVKATMTIYRAAFTLQDDNDPTASSPSGELVASGVKRGTLSASYVASDKGGGVYRTLVKVDGKVVESEVGDANGGSCRDQVPGGDPYDGFVRAVPCELTSSVSPTFDTSKVTDGAHKLSLEVEDAAGNRTVVFPATTFDFRNAATGGAGTGGAGTGGAGSGAGTPGGGGPPVEGAPSRTGPNGFNATRLARIVLRGKNTSRRKVRYGRSINVIGRLLTPSDKPIVGASLDVFEKVALRGEQARRVYTVRTDRSGYFSYPARPGPSRVVEVAYEALVPARGSSPEVDYDVRERVELVVFAGVRLTVKPRTARNLQTLRFTGRLLGSPLPERGKLVLVQAQVKRLRKVSWQTFLTLSTDSKGRFSGRYRLTRSRRATGYKFRAIVPEGDDYPYRKGVSKVGKVKIVR
jgi:hypothetical protein